MEHRDVVGPGSAREPGRAASVHAAVKVGLPEAVGVVVAATSGIAVWIGVIPDSGSVGGFYFPLMCIAAFAITFVLRVEPWLVPVALVVPQLVIAALSPPGDNDGLQLLWFPFLAFILLVLMVPAGVGQWLRGRLS